MDGSCPCGSKRPYRECCEPLLRGDHSAETAEGLMRSRYSAYVVGAIDYIHETLHPDHRQDHDLEAARRWSTGSEWLGLEIVATTGGGVGESQGVVEFKAHYRNSRGVTRTAHEVSRFESIDGRWYYVDGEMPRPDTVQRQQRKVGRNEPCPCGSGKKYKKCCN